MAHRQIIVGAAFALADDDVTAAVLQVLGLSVSLTAVSQNGNRLVFQKGKVGIVVVVNCDWHEGGLSKSI
jgi:hypothetical protein